MLLSITLCIISLFFSCPQFQIDILHPLILGNRLFTVYFAVGTLLSVKQFILLLVVLVLENLYHFWFANVSIWTWLGPIIVGWSKGHSSLLYGLVLNICAMVGGAWGSFDPDPVKLGHYRSGSHYIIAL